MLALEIPGASVQWTPRTAFWRRGSEPAEPDLRIDVPGWDETVYVDVAVVFPASSTPGRQAQKVEGEKEDAYPVWCERVRIQPVGFSACVLESFGRFGPRSAALVRRLAEENAAAWGLRAAVETRRWFSLLSRRLQLDQADILLNSCL